MFQTQTGNGKLRKEWKQLMNYIEGEGKEVQNSMDILNVIVYRAMCLRCRNVLVMQDLFLDLIMPGNA